MTLDQNLAALIPPVVEPLRTAPIFFAANAGTATLIASLSVPSQARAVPSLGGCTHLRGDEWVAGRE